jgi:chemotaxis signal transduction protein
MSDHAEPRSLLEVVVGGTPLLVEKARILATDTIDGMQRNPTDKPPFGWMLGTFEGLEVWHLGTCLGGRATLPAGGGAVLVAERPSGERWGLLVERASAVVEVAAIHPLGSVLGNSAFAALAETPQGPRLVLDLDRLHPYDKPAAADQGPLQAPIAAVGEREDPRMVWIPVVDANAVVGLSARQVVEIRQPAPFAPMPRTSGPLVGAAVIEGQALPVMDVGRMIDPAAAPTVAKRMLIARGSRSGRHVALQVPADIRMIDLPIANRPRPDDGHQNVWVRGVFDVGDTTLIVPDLDAVVA